MYDCYGTLFNQDKAAHKTYAFAMDARSIFRPVPYTCIHCGGEIGVYYCEEALLLVRCMKCHTAALTEARNYHEERYGSNEPLRRLLWKTFISKCFIQLKMQKLILYH